MLFAQIYDMLILFIVLFLRITGRLQCWTLLQKVFLYMTLILVHFSPPPGAEMY